VAGDGGGVGGATVGGVRVLNTGSFGAIEADSAFENMLASTIMRRWGHLFVPETR
jgi:hypothetical protein